MDKLISQNGRALNNINKSQNTKNTATVDDVETSSKDIKNIIKPNNTSTDISTDEYKASETSPKQSIVKTPAIAQATEFNNNIYNIDDVTLGKEHREACMREAFIDRLRYWKLPESAIKNALNLFNTYNANNHYVQESKLLNNQFLTNKIQGKLDNNEKVYINMSLGAYIQPLNKGGNPQGKTRPCTVSRFADMLLRSPLESGFSDNEREALTIAKNIKTCTLTGSNQLVFSEVSLSDIFRKYSVQLASKPLPTNGQLSSTEYDFLNKVGDMITQIEKITLDKKGKPRDNVIFTMSGGNYSGLSPNQPDKTVREIYFNAYNLAHGTIDVGSTHLEDTSNTEVDGYENPELDSKIYGKKMTGSSFAAARELADQYAYDHGYYKAQDFTNSLDPDNPKGYAPITHINAPGLALQSKKEKRKEQEPLLSPQYQIIPRRGE